MNTRKPSVSNVEEYLADFGPRGMAKLKVLNRLIPYLQAVAFSDPGKTILADDLDRCMALMEKGYRDELTDDEKAELKYLKGRLDKIATALHTFESTQAEIMGEREKRDSERK